MTKFDSYADVIKEFDWLPLALALNPQDAILRLVRLIYFMNLVESMDAREIDQIFGERAGHC